MARLPRISPDAALTPQIQSSVSGADVARASPFGVAGETAALLGNRLSAIAKDYEAGVALGVTATEVNAAGADAMRIAEEAKGDPELFAQAWEIRSRDRLQKIDPRHRDSIAAKFIDIGGAAQRGLMADGIDRDRKIALERIDARQDAITTQLVDLAAAGRSGSPESLSLHDELTGLVAEKVGNRFLAYPQERADLDLAKVDEALIGAAVTGELQEIYRTQGIGAAKARAQQINADDSLGVDRTTKLKAINTALTSVRSLYAADVESRKQVSADIGDVVAELADGRRAPDDPLIGDLLGVADELGARDAKARLIQAAQTASLVRPMATLGLPDRLKFINGLLTPITEPPAGPDERGTSAGRVVDKIVTAEGTAANPASSAIGTGQFIERTWLSTVRKYRPDLAAGRTDQQVLNLRTNAAVGREMVARYAEENAAALRGSGLSGSDEQIYLAHFLGPGDAVAVLKASPTTPLAGLISAQSIAANKTVLEGRTAGDVIAWAAGKVGAAAPDSLSGLAKGVIPQIRASIAEATKAALADARTMLDHDRPPDDRTLNALIRGARIANDPGVYDDVGQIIARTSVVRGSLDMPSPDQAGLIEALRVSGPVGDEMVRLAALDQAEATHRRMTAMLETDPRGLGIQMGLFTAGPQIDAANIAAVPQILAARVPQLAMVANAEHYAGALPLLSPAEADTLKGIWKGANTNQRLAMLAQLVAAPIPRDSLMATLGKFTESGDQDGATLAIAGALMSDNPEAGAAVVRGVDALKTNPDFAFGEEARDYLNARDEYFPSTVVAPGLEPAHAEALRAARAVYADASAQAGDSSGAFNEDRWQRAVDLVTGGLVEWNGQKTIAPSYGMSQSEFERIMAALPEWAVSGAATAEGTAIPASYLRDSSNVRLQGYGDGRYLIGVVGGTGLMFHAMAVPRSETVAVTRPGSEPWTIPFGAGIHIPAATDNMRLSDVAPPGFESRVFVLDLRPFKDGVYRAPEPNPPAGELPSRFREYQRAVGADQTAPPPLAPQGGGAWWDNLSLTEQGSQP